jgi:hypothetical protein
MTGIRYLTQKELDEPAPDWGLRLEMIAAGCILPPPLNVGEEPSLPSPFVRRPRQGFGAPRGLYESSEGVLGDAPSGTPTVSPNLFPSGQIKNDLERVLITTPRRR